MTIAEPYAALARMIDYPEKKETLHAGSEAVGRFLQEQEIACSLTPFTEFVAEASLAALQEEYVATFDFSPAKALYLGHHLYGDNQKKALCLIRIKEEFRRYRFTPSSNDLPDHLPLVLEFLAHLARQEAAGVRRVFISDCVLPAMERLMAAFENRKNSPWQPVAEAARRICCTDAAISKEERPC